MPIPRFIKSRIRLTEAINTRGVIVSPYSKYKKSGLDYRKSQSSKKCGNYIYRDYAYNAEPVTVS